MYKEIQMATYAILIGIVTLITHTGNFAILYTLSKSKTLGRSIKLHLGAVTFLDSLTAILLLSRYILDEFNNLGVIPCKILITLVVFTVCSLSFTNISMAIECLALLRNVHHTHFGCLQFQSWHPTRKTYLTVIAMVLLGATGAIGCIMAPVKYDVTDFNCAVTDSLIFHPIMLKEWTIQTTLLLLIHLTLLGILVGQLWMFDKSTRVEPMHDYRCNKRVNYKDSNSLEVPNIRRVNVIGVKKRQMIADRKYESQDRVHGVASPRPLVELQELKASKIVAGSNTEPSVCNPVLNPIVTHRPSSFEMHNQQDKSITRNEIYRYKPQLIPNLKYDRHIFKTQMNKQSANIRYLVRYTQTNHGQFSPPDDVNTNARQSIQIISNLSNSSIHGKNTKEKEVPVKSPDISLLAPFKPPELQLVPLDDTSQSASLSKPRIKPKMRITPPTPQPRRKQVRKSINKRAKRKARVMLMAIATCFYMCCYTPYVVTLCLFTFCADHCGIDEWYVKAAATFTVTHGLLNVFLYIANNEDFRKDVLATFRCKCRFRIPQCIR